MSRSVRGLALIGVPVGLALVVGIGLIVWRWPAAPRDIAFPVEPPPPFTPNLRPPPESPWRLSETATTAAIPIPDRALEATVYLEEVNPYGAGERPRTGTGLLRRELFRQAALIAARDELGVTTRDAALGEVPPHGLPTSNRVRIRVRAEESGGKWTCAVECGAATTPREVWAAESATGLSDRQLNILPNAEELSRTGFVTAFQRIGGWQPPAKADSTAGVPPAVEALLARLTVVSQVGAARGLHAAIRQRGESPNLLAALSRCYANLGLLTDQLWDGSTWVFKARSLLYAERFRHRYPADPLVLWHRAYALALVGRHTDALSELDAAGQQAAPDGQPDWAPLVSALCRFDSGELARKAKDGGDSAQLAGLFHFLTVEDQLHPKLAVEVGREFLRGVPECHRVQDSLARMGGVGVKHASTLVGLSTLAEGYRIGLRQLADVPEPLGKLLEADDLDPDALIDGLTAAGRVQTDRAELSWAALGRLARESRLTFFEARLSFLHHSLAVPTDEYLEEVKAVAGDHPMYPLLETYRLDSRRNVAGIGAVLGKLSVQHLTSRHVRFLAANGLLPEAARPPLFFLGEAHGEYSYSDQIRSLWSMLPGPQILMYATRMRHESPSCPLARALVIDHDWPTAEPHAARWEADAQHPCVLNALARHALRANRLDEAERLFRRSLELVKDSEVYVALAGVHRSRGDEAKWLATMEEGLTAPGEGLEAAQVRTALARHHLRQKQFAKAREYADAAAETGAGWAMTCAAECAEADDDLEAAEKWHRRTSERYAESYSGWYYWCLRTGKGDGDAARAVVDAHLKRVGGNRTPADRVVAGVVHMADAKPEKAAPLFEAVFALNQDDFFLLSAALAWDAAGQVANRDRVLQAAPAGGTHASLAQFFRATLARGETACPTKEALDAAVAKLPDAHRLNASYFVGQFVLRRGDTKLAARYFTPVAQLRSTTAVSAVLAGLALRGK